MANVPQSRREFFAAVIALSLSAAALWRFLTPRRQTGTVVVARVAASEVPASGALVFREQRLALLREGDGFYALQLICTHLGCTVAVTENGLSCPCHGSHFDRRGNVLRGPAIRSLSRHSVAVHNGLIEIYAL